MIVTYYFSGTASVPGHVGAGFESRTENATTHDLQMVGSECSPNSSISYTLTIMHTFLF